METPTGQEVQRRTSIRSINPADINRAKKIHEKHYKEEFSFPDFFRKFDCAFAIGDPPIIYGGVKQIAEVVMVTDKDSSVRARKEALHKMHEASSIVAAKCGYNQIHVFITDPVYAEQLKRNGFRTAVGECLVYDVG